jgi:hypothetical protein
LDRSAQQQLAENLQQNAAGSSPTVSPRIAIACLILIVLMAGFFVADEYTSCRQEHGPNYKCFPGGRRLLRYTEQIRRGEIHCACGETFNARVHEETMAHIEHITGRAFWKV